MGGSMKSLLFAICAGIFLPAMVHAQIIVTYAGNGTSGHSGDGSPATMAELQTPSGVAVDTAGNVFITDQNGSCIRKVSRSGIITTIAGSSHSITGYSGDMGPATDAALYWPEGLTTDVYGNVYIADQNNCVIRKVDASGIITTIAGTGTIGYSGDGGPATAALLYHPADITVDGSGNVYFVDQDNCAVRKIAAATGFISTIAGNGSPGFAGDGGPATASKLCFPQGIACDTSGNIYVADFYNRRIRKIDLAGNISTVAGNGTTVFSGDGGPATAAGIDDASAVAVDRHGNIYLTDYYSFRIRKIDSAGIINTVAGDSLAGYSGDCGPATDAELNYPEGVAVDGAGNIYIADFYNHRVRMVTDSAYCPVIATTSVETIQTKGVAIFPNPSADVFNISLATNGIPGNSEPNEVTIFDITGQKVFHSYFYMDQTRIDVSAYHPGIYFVYLSSGSGSCVNKVIVARP